MPTRVNGQWVYAANERHAGRTYEPTRSGEFGSGPGGQLYYREVATPAGTQQAQAQTGLNGAGSGNNGLPSSAQAMADANRFNRSSLNSFNNAAGNAGAMANYAGTLAGAGTGLMSQFNQNFAPTINQLPGMANIPISSYVNRAANDVHGQFDRTRGIAERQMGRMGINPNSGRFAGMQAGLQQAEAAGAAGAMTDAAFRGQQENFGRTADVARIGLGMQSQGAGQVGQAGGLMGAAAGVNSNLGGAYQGLANNAAGYSSMATQNQELQGQLGSIVQRLDQIFGPGGAGGIAPNAQKTA